MNLDRLFSPAAMAIVDASQDLTTISGQPVAHLKSPGYRGAIYPVNSKHEDIGGKVYAVFGSPFKMEPLHHGPVSMVSQSGGCGYPILAGARGKPPVDVDALAKAIVKLGALAIDLKEFVAELDINALFVFPSGGVKAGDALIKLAPPE